MSPQFPPFARVRDRDRRALIVGLGIVSVLVIIGRGGPLWRSWERERLADRAELVSGLARSHTILRDTHTVAESLAARRARLTTLDSVLLDGGSAAAATAALTTTLARAAEEAGVRLTSSYVSVDSGGDGAIGPIPRAEVFRVAVTATGDGDAAGLAALLAWLEESPPLLSVKKLTVTGADVTLGPGQPEHLRISLTVEGIAWRRAAGAAP